MEEVGWRLLIKHYMNFTSLIGIREKFLNLDKDIGL